jgi:hypothetical protein
MKSNKKPSSLAVLKNLPPERQAEVWSRLTVKTAAWPDISYAAVRKWLAQDGLKTSQASLSDFFSWYPLQQQFRADEVTTESLLEQIKAEVQGLTEEQLDEIGQRTFSLLAIRRQDLDGFVNVRSARTKAQLEKAKLKLRERAEDRMSLKLKMEMDKRLDAACEKLLDAATRAKADEINASSMSQAEKIKAMRQEYFKDVDELMASGKVVLPE